MPKRGPAKSNWWPSVQSHFDHAVPELLRDRTTEAKRGKFHPDSGDFGCCSWPADVRGLCQAESGPSSERSLGPAPETSGALHAVGGTGSYTEPLPGALDLFFRYEPERPHIFATARKIAVATANTAKQNVTCGAYLSPTTLKAAAPPTSAPMKLSHGRATDELTTPRPALTTTNAGIAAAIQRIDLVASVVGMTS